MLSEEPPNPIANAQQQNHRVSVSVVKPGIGKTLLPPMPSRKSKKDSAKVKNVCTYCWFAQTPPWPEEPLAQRISCTACGYGYKPGQLCPEDSAKVESIERKCTHCGITQTSQWRHGPLGRRTLCNACGVRYKSGRLCPEYRPANSPTFSNKLHSNAHRKVMEIRKQKYGMVGTVSKPVDKRTNSTTTLMKLKKDLFPAVETLNISEQPSVIAIAEQQSPVPVLENSRNSSMTLMSSSGTVDPPHQAPSEFLGQQQQFCDQANNMPKENDTATVEIEGNSTTLMSSCGIKIPHRARSKGLRRRRSAIPGQQVGIDRKCLHCGKQTQRWRMGSLGPTTLCNASGNRYEPLWGRSGVTVDIANKCQHCGSEETTQWLSCPLRPKTLCNACYHWFKYGQRQFCNQTNNNPDKKARAEEEIRRNCRHCGAEQTPLWRPGPLGSKTLCNACGIRWYKFGDLCREYRPASRATFARELRSNYYRKVTGMRKQDIGVEMVVEPVDKKNTIGE